MPQNSPSEIQPDSSEKRPAIRMAAWIILVVVGGWFMLGELKTLFRPLLFAVLSTYALMPIYGRLRKFLPTSAAVVALSAVVTALFAVLALSVAASVITITSDESTWRNRAILRVRQVSEWAHGFSFIGAVPEGQKPPEVVFTEQFTSLLVTQLRAAAVGLPEIFAAGLYLLFLLVESARFPDRIRRAYLPERAKTILSVFGEINSAIISYLRAKVVSSLWLAVPVGIIFAVFGVPFAVLWAVLTFVCNFIPYLGSVIAYSLPMLFAVVEFGFGGQLAVVGGLVLGVHLLGAAVVEPMILGRAVGISPLAILASLSLWGILWGVPGMFLAVPLTVVLKIVFEHLPGTRPVARLISDR